MYIISFFSDDYCLLPFIGFNSGFGVIFKFIYTGAYLYIIPENNMLKSNKYFINQI